MKLFNKLFGKQDKKIKSYEDFWNWFTANEQRFYKVVETGKKIETNFFNKLSPKLEELKDGYFYVTGMYNEHTAELIFTPDGIVNNIVFVEELVSAAPALPNWRFTALKPALAIEDVRIEMEDYTFDKESLSFYPIEHENYPDEVDLVVAHKNYKEDDKANITNGVYLFLDNYLGELKFVTTIDNLSVISIDQAVKELIPIAKLKDYLIWREKEFIEKYEGVHHDSENDSYSSLEGTLKNGLPLVAIINRTLLNWDSKASHPWLLNIEIKYDGSEHNGMPEDDTYKLMNDFENEIMQELKDFDGYLNLGRQTANNERLIYFACKNFRKPAKLLHTFKTKYESRLDFEYDIYKDKYWQSLERFMP